MSQQLEGVRLTLDLWHPTCWAIEATDRTKGGVLAHAIYNSPKMDENLTEPVKGLFTAFAETGAKLETLLNAIRESDYSGELSELQKRFGRKRDMPGTVVREFFLEYDPTDMICPTLLENGFVHSEPIRIQDGSEEWNVCFTGERSDLKNALNTVREQAGAEITVTSITTSKTADRSSRDQRLDLLTPAQRDVFELAREAGYYEWPRQTTTRELADELDISKATMLEHLQKAESKLLDP
ncbi:helix-turn-helix domain-containing protein [Halorussus salinisoli]|uniref:helix-turn-helix domain-containing protein n=1 Tax=Halorussus salinisoli TaxID=2558242 RepID=UPI0010C166E7|nr:helix-turn-helix domain-containing protein [Halorussus salinisoli]